jgi:uncharacterized membrane protein
MERTSFGLDENSESAIAYVLGFITGIFFLLMEDENRTVRFHAMQSTLLSFGIAVAIIVFSIVPVLSFLIPVVWLIEVILWLLLIVTAFRGKMIRLPVFGTIAASYV